MKSIQALSCGILLASFSGASCKTLNSPNSSPKAEPSSAFKRILIWEDSYDGVPRLWGGRKVFFDKDLKTDTMILNQEYYVEGIITGKDGEMEIPKGEQTFFVTPFEASFLAELSTNVLNFTGFDAASRIYSALDYKGEVIKLTGQTNPIANEVESFPSQKQFVVKYYNAGKSTVFYSLKPFVKIGCGSDVTLGMQKEGNGDISADLVFSKVRNTIGRADKCAVSTKPGSTTYNCVFLDPFTKELAASTVFTKIDGEDFFKIDVTMGTETMKMDCVEHSPEEMASQH